MNKDGLFEGSGFATHLVGIGNADVYIMNYLENENTVDPKLSRAFHTHACTEIFFCPCESYSVFIDDYKITLNKNDFLIIPSGCSHIKDPDVSAPWGAMLVFSAKRQVSEGTDMFTPLNELFGNGKIWLIRGDNELAEAFSAISCIAEKELSPSQLLDAVKLFVKLTLSKRKLMGEYEAGSNFSIKDAIDFERLSAVVSRFKQSRQTLSQAAKSMYVSERQFSRYCLKFFGKNYYDITLDIQLKTAAYYLTHTDKSIEEIAGLINMNTTFARNFNKVYGVSPTQYRKLHRE